MRRFFVRKRIIESATQSSFNFFVAEDGNCVTKIKLKQPEIVESSQVIGVLMRVHHGIHDSNFFTQQLLPEIWRSIDQKIAFRQAQNCTGSGPLVTRVIALTDVACTADCRYAD